MQIAQGVYRHYKGGLYTVLFSAVSADNRDDREASVVYVSHTTGQVYTRLEREFFSEVADNTYVYSPIRFEFVGETVGPPVKR